MGHGEGRPQQGANDADAPLREEDVTEADSLDEREREPLPSEQDDEAEAS